MVRAELTTTEERARLATVCVHINGIAINTVVVAANVNGRSLFDTAAAAAAVCT